LGDDMQASSNRKSLPARLSVLWSYLRRPVLYGALIQLLRSKASMALGLTKDTRASALSWCQSCAVDTATALTMLTGKAPSEGLRSSFPDEFRFAEGAANACPVAMGGPANLQFVYQLCEYLSARRVLETGVAYGWSSLAILLSLQKRKDARLVSTDMPYPGRDNDLYVGCVVPEHLRNQWEIIRSSDRRGLPQAILRVQPLDICHYDSDKSYEGRMWAYPRIWASLREGGILISDDIGDNLAFHDFAQRMALQPIVAVYENRYCGVLVKPSA
jgi:predicted O-methyltransferase YrrM